MVKVLIKYLQIQLYIQFEEVFNEYGFSSAYGIQLNVSSTSISISAKCLMITAREPGPNEERCAFIYQYFSYYRGEEASLEMSVVS